MHRLLNLIADLHDAGLRVDRSQRLLVRCAAPVEEQVWEHVAVVADEEGVCHVGELLRVLLSEVEGRGGLVRDDVIHIAGAAGARVAKPHDLQRDRGEGREREGEREREREREEREIWGEDCI